MTVQLVLSCEHASCHVPAAYRKTLRGASCALRSHRAYDIGALALARQLASHCRAPLRTATVSRLLVDVNRSLGHRNLFSEWSRQLDQGQRQAILDRYWWPYRNAVEEEVRAALAARRKVLHVAVHTFCPKWRGVTRQVDVGLLYDPRHAHERRIASAYLAELAAAVPGLRLRRNHPYRGTADGLTRHLRRQLPDDRYFGLELEVNQRFPRGTPVRWQRMQKALAAALARVL